MFNFDQNGTKWHVLVSVYLIGLLNVHFADAQVDRQVRHRVPAEYMSYMGAEWLERSDRVVEEQPHRVLETMDLKPGDVVADVGCGSGYYARQIAPLVLPGGVVYCEDIQPEMLEIMRELAADESVLGIESILGTPVDPMLPSGEIDWVIITDVYHEMSQPEPMLAGIRESLATGGRVALLEYRVEDGTGDQIKADHRMSVRQVLDEWKAAGFELVDLHDFLPSQHFFVFRASDDSDASVELASYDLFDAIDQELVEVNAIGAGDRLVNLRMRRTGEEPIVVTSQVGTYFESGDGIRDMIASRDGWIVLSDDRWHEWSVRVVGRQPNLDTPGTDDALTILLPSNEPVITDLLYQLQTGTYTVANSPTLYPFVSHGTEQAAVWITDADLEYHDIISELEESRLPDQYAVAFALVFVDRVGIDVKTRQVWNDSENLFGAIRDQGLSVWYRLKTSE